MEDLELTTSRALTDWRRVPRPVLLLLTAVAVRGGRDGITKPDALFHARWTFGGRLMSDATLRRAWLALLELTDGNGEPIVDALPGDRYALAVLREVTP
ncbi:hypothetical protein [Micromonospora sp. RP3T]|uniref:hypothetical protein n=1 Tax=Micromonospora sp. RP3T TaxID=2135446 RepID=UPI003D765C92